MQLTAVTVDSNTMATSSYGGNAGARGIENTGNLTVVSSTISNDQATSQSGSNYVSYAGICFGGGIDNSGNATVVNSTISGDSAEATGTALAYGGGILNSGNLTLSDSTVSGDTVTTTTQQYAGLYGLAVPHDSRHRRREKVRRQSYGYGSYYGGSYYYTGVATGGGVETFGQGVTTISNSIISGNADVAVSNYAGYYGTVSAPDVSGTFSSLGHNLIGQTNGSSGWTAADLTGTTASPLNANLGPLANNGGPTQTMLPLTGSPAIDAGSNSLIPSGITTDQRGLAAHCQRHRGHRIG